MAWYPEADRSNVLKGFGTKMRGHRGVVLHVAVSEARFPSYGKGLGAHFYVRKDGSVAQQIDTDIMGGHAKEGNSTLIGVETQGGMVNAQGEPWTPAQEAALKRLLKWLYQTHGIPMQPMRDSRPTSRGVGYHRLGIDPYRVPGGEVWSSSYGKICPGDAKIAQVSGLIGAGVDVTPTPQEEDDMFTNEDRAKLDLNHYAINKIILPALSGVATRVAKIASTDGADEGAIIAGVLAGLSPEKIAEAVVAAVPSVSAGEVADLIAERIKNG